MNTHYRNYSLFINNKYICSKNIEAISQGHIDRIKQSCINEQIKLKKCKITDTFQWKLSYCFT